MPPILRVWVLQKPALGTFLRLHSPRPITLVLRILGMVSVSCFHVIAVPLQISSPSISALPFTALIASFPALNPTYRPHQHHPVSTPSSIRPPPSILMFSSRRPSVAVAVDAAYRGYNPPSIQHDIQLPPQLPTGLGSPYSSLEQPYRAHHGPPPAQARPLPQSARLCMHRLCQVSPVPAVPATQAFTSFLSRPPVFGSSHCNSSASYHEMEVYSVPSSEPDSMQWYSPPTSSGLPVTPPDHTVAPQLPCLSQLQPPKSPQPLYVPASMLPFSPTHTTPALSTGHEEQFTNLQAPLKSKLTSNERTKDVFQSLKRKRLPLAASFSRPKPRTLPVKKVLPKIHGCPTCGKMFDRPSTLLVVSIVPHLALIASTLSNRQKAPGQPYKGQRSARQLFLT